jgi:glycosyltransferase involved in cell wall biosynthesis
VKILFAGEYFVPDAPGGAEWSVYHWIEALASRGHKVAMVTPDLSGRSLPAASPTDQALFRSGDVTITRFPFSRAMGSPPRVFPSYVFGNPIFARAFSRHIEKAAADCNADLIAAQGLDSIVPVYMAAQHRSIPAVATIRDYRALCPNAICLHREQFAPETCTLGKFIGCLDQYHADYGAPGSPIKKARTYARRMIEWANVKRIRKTLPNLDGAVFVSEAIRGVYDRSRLCPDRTAVVYNLPPSTIQTEGKDARERFSLEDSPFLLFVGRFSLGKGAGIIERAMPMLREKVPEATIVVAGNSEYEGTIPEGVKLVGHVDRETLDSLYTAARAVVLPSRWQEPFSRVLLEAAAASTPAIASRSGGNEEGVTHQENGFLFDREKPEEFASACAEMLTMPEDKYSRMQGEMAKRIDTKFSRDRLVEKLESFYTGLIGRGD